VLLPWATLFGFALWNPSLPNLGIAALGLGLSVALLRGAPEGPLDLRRSLASLSINFVGLWFMTHREHATDPLTLGLIALGVPEPEQWVIPALAPLGLSELGFLHWPLLLAALILALLVLSASKVRLLFILLASDVFYAHWDWRFLFLIWGSSTADWLLGNAIAGAGSPRA